MQPPAPAAESPAVPWLRRLLRPKFSLRTLLLGMAVLGAGLGMFQRLDRQRQLVSRIEAAGGRCVYRIDIDRFNDPWLIKRLPQCYFDDVCSVKFDENSESVDEILLHLAELKSLEMVYLTNTPVSDAGLRHLAELKSLKWLYIGNTLVDGSGLAHLVELKSLELLYLADTSVGDAELRHLAPLKSLKWIFLDNTQVSDAGLPHLAGLKSLERLDVGNTHVSAAGIEQLQTSLPDCRIFGP